MWMMTLLLACRAPSPSEAPPGSTVADPTEPTRAADTSTEGDGSAATLILAAKVTDGSTPLGLPE